MSNPEVIYDEIDMLKTALNRQDLSVTIVDHPLVRQQLSFMRNQDTCMTAFRTAVQKLTPFLVYEATKNFSEIEFAIETPLAPITTRRLKNKVVLIPVLRSGVGMLEPAQNTFPDAPTIFAGMARDETTAIAHWYLAITELQDLNSGEGVVFLILDPMLATGGSAIETVKEIKAIYPKGMIKMIAIISAPEGIKALNEAYPDVPITTAAVDDHLNEQFYIVPGLGDAGDRQFGTT